MMISGVTHFTKAEFYVNVIANSAICNLLHLISLSSKKNEQQIQETHPNSVQT